VGIALPSARHRAVRRHDAQVMQESAELLQVSNRLRTFPFDLGRDARAILRPRSLVIMKGLTMKKILLASATALSLAATGAYAGGIAPVVVEEVPVVETKPASSISPLLILGLIILIGIAVSQNDDEEEEE
jgi:hypothetical protein